MLRQICKLICLMYALGFSSLDAAHFENLVDLTFKVEDASFCIKMKSLKFNDEEIKLDPSDMFRSRKVLQYKLPPGRYFLYWSTEQTSARWSDPPVKNHEKILVLESGDGIVRVNIKGDSISIY
jgi:hypothetical protein